MRLAIRTVKEKVMLTVLVTAVLLGGIAASRVTYRRFRIAREIDRIEQEIVQLKRERDELERSRATAEDFAAVERAAREILNLKREDERVVVLLPSGETENVVQEEAMTEREPSNPEKWWAYFFADSPSDR